MISVIITTYKEPETLPKAIQAILNDIRNSEEFVPTKVGILTEVGIISRETFEILVVGPDKETEKIVKKFQQKLLKLLSSADFNDRQKQRNRILIRYLKDKGIGKPAALNLAFQEARGEILVLTDGDVWMGKNSLRYLLAPFFAGDKVSVSQRQVSVSPRFAEGKVGAVSGHPVSINSRENLFGYWSHFLTDAADFVRRKKTRRGEYLVCSGYLYAIRNLIKEIPEQTLVEDSIISQLIWQKGYKIAYEPEAIVYVKYPDNFSDWLKQKIRATGGYVQKIKSQKSKVKSCPPSHKASADAPISNQIKDLKKLGKMRGFLEEISDGIKLFFTYPKNLKEFFWTKLLYLARLYLWLMIFWQIKILKKPSWPRVESTK